MPDQESTYYMVHLYEFLEQTRLIYNSGKQIRPERRDRKLIAKGHKKTVQGDGNVHYLFKKIYFIEV